MSEYVFKLPDLGEGTVESERHESVAEPIRELGEQGHEVRVVGRQ